MVSDAVYIPNQCFNRITSLFTSSSWRVHRKSTINRNLSFEEGEGSSTSSGHPSEFNLFEEHRRSTNVLVTSSFSAFEKSVLPKAYRQRSQSICNMTTMKTEELEIVKKIRLGRIRNKFFKGGRTERGAIQISLTHDGARDELRIRVIRGSNLLSSDANGFSDPFVKIYMLPGRDKENKRKTPYKSKTLNPEWNETLVFPHIHVDELKYKTLEVTVWDYDRLSANDFLGSIKLDLSDPNIVDGNPRWYKLEKKRLKMN